MRILVIGESCSDIYQYGECVRLAPEAPVPIIKIDDSNKKEMPGMAMNVYNNIFSLAGSVGDIAIKTNPNWKEVKKTRFVDYRTNYIILRADEGDDEIQRCDVEKIDFSIYDIVVISDYNKGYLLEEDIEFISMQHPVTLLDTKKILGDWCKNITFIKINDFEFNRTKHKLTDQIRDKMVVTLGPDGASHKGVIYPVPKVEIKDTAGAGDTFISALAVRYALTEDIEESIQFANKCATIVVQKKGVSTI